jgi:D-alanyl-D-alanine carboxypeptidase
MQRRQWLRMAGTVCFALPFFAQAREAKLGKNSRFDEPVNRFVEKDGFNGVVLAGRNANIDFLRGYGMANAEAGLPMTTTTRFETGSVSKWIAAIVVMKLVEQGLLALDRPIAAYLPQYREDIANQVTLRHLMSHSSGIPNDIDAARKADPAIKLIELPQMEAVRRYASGELLFRPGTAWDYSHANWLVAKAVVEAVSQKSYRELVRALLITPLGLNDSGIFTGLSSDVTGMAIGYAKLLPRPERKVSGMPDYMAMAGGFYATAADLFKLMDGVLGADGILSTSSRQTLMRVNMPDQHYALGGRTRTVMVAGMARECAWEDGSNGGFRILARRTLQDGHAVVVLTNASFDYQKLGDIGDALLEKTYA